MSLKKKIRRWASFIVPLFLTAIILYALVRAGILVFQQLTITPGLSIWARLLVGAIFSVVIALVAVMIEIIWKGMVKK